MVPYNIPHAAHSPLHTEKAWECINITNGIWASVLLSSNTHSSLSLPLFLFKGCTRIAISVLLLSHRKAHLVQLPQQDLSKVEGGEADPNRNGPFDPVHTETFVESTDNSFLRHNLPHSAQDGAVSVARDTCSLHAASYHIQRVRCWLADKPCTGSKG